MHPLLKALLLASVVLWAALPAAADGAPPSICVASLAQAGAVAAQPALGDSDHGLVWMNQCTVTINCSEGGQVSCSSDNNDCTTSGDCAICDGIQRPQNCCPNACLDFCAQEFYACISACPPGIGPCNLQCQQERNDCEDFC